MCINRWVDKEDVVYTYFIYIYTYNGILARKNNEMSSFITTWMDTDSILLSKIVRGRQMLCDFTYIWNLKNKTNEQT